MSRTSASSKRAGSSSSGKKTRPLTSEATSSRLDSVEQPLSSPLKKPTTKRKRQSETPATTSSGAVQADEQNELSRPRKKQRTEFETVLSPISISSDEDRDALLGPKAWDLQKKVLPKNSAASLDEDDDSPPKAKGKSVRRSDARSAGTAASSRASGVRAKSGLPRSKTKTKTVPRRKERVADADALSDVSQDEEPRPSKSKKKSTSKQKSPSEQNDELSEKEVDSAVSHIKTTPPRRLIQLGEMRPKLILSHTKPREDDSEEEHVPGEESTGHPCDEASPSVLMQQDAVNNHNSTPSPPHISIPQVLLSARPGNPDLSPGTRARLELFDRMMNDPSPPDATTSPDDVPKCVPDEAYINYDTHDDFNTHDLFRPLSPSPSKSKPKHSKLSTPNGLVVPETESSGNSQSQSQPLLQLPPSQPPPTHEKSPPKPIDLPTIAVITASVTSSSVSPRDLFPPLERLPPHTNHRVKRQIFKPVPQISPDTFRSTINPRSLVTDSEAPPSSIESFTSPKRVEKGKQRAVDDDQLQSSLSEEEGVNVRRKRLAQRKITDSELKKRGKELFDQVQLAREAGQQKKQKVKRLKIVNGIVNGTVSSPPKDSPLPSISGLENTLPMRWEDMVDLSGGANSTTLDTPVHSEVKPLSEEDRERLRIELRQEEEENTQEAMGSYPLPPVKKSEVVDSGNTQMPPPKSPKVIYIA